jgi:hypothetical protein
MGFMDTLRYKVELYRLEQRYTRREKRTTFISGAQYVDGEYVYAGSPSYTSSPTQSSNSSSTSGSWGSLKRIPSASVKEVLTPGRSKRQSRAF